MSYEVGTSCLWRLRRPRLHSVIENASIFCDTRFARFWGMRCHPERRRETPKSKDLKQFKSVQVQSLGVFLLLLKWGKLLCQKFVSLYFLFFHWTRSIKPDWIRRQRHHQRTKQYKMVDHRCYHRRSCFLLKNEVVRIGYLKSGLLGHYEQKHPKLQFFYLKFLFFSASNRLRTLINKVICKTRFYRASVRAEVKQKKQFGKETGKPGVGEAR